jgi:hypothetical protein
VEDSQDFDPVGQDPIVDDVWEPPQATRPDVLPGDGEQLRHRRQLVEAET